MKVPAKEIVKKNGRVYRAGQEVPETVEKDKAVIEVEKKEKPKKIKKGVNDE